MFSQNHVEALAALLELFQDQPKTVALLKDMKDTTEALTKATQDQIKVNDIASYQQKVEDYCNDLFSKLDSLQEKLTQDQLSFEEFKKQAFKDIQEQDTAAQVQKQEVQDKVQELQELRSFLDPKQEELRLLETRLQMKQLELQSKEQEL